jgi:protein O-GlcNAc transferase
MPTPSQAFQLAAQHHAAGRFNEAEAICRQIVAADPAHSNAWLLLGVIALHATNLAAAIECLQQAVLFNPHDAMAHNNLGIALTGKGDFRSSAVHFRRAAELAPDMPEAHYNLAHGLQALGDLQQAKLFYQQAIALKPDFADAWLNIANIVSGQGEFALAIDHYRRSLQLHPQQPEALVELAAALQRLGRSDEAVDCCRFALALRPDFPEAYNRLGIALRFLGSIDEAVACFRSAVEQDPNHIQALNNLGSTLKDAGQLEQAVDCLRLAVARRPDFVPAHSNLLYSLQFSPKYDAAAIYEEHRRFSVQHAAPLVPTIAPHTNSSDSNRRLRIAYASPHFRNHTLAFALVPLFRCHDHADFEIVCYHDEPIEDDITRELRKHADAWHNIVGLTDEEVAARIRHDKIDVLVDLTMHMSGSRPLLFARKPAPIQVCWLAYPGTTGLSTMDYRLADPHLDPPGLFDAYYSESSLRLPHTFWCYDPLTDQPPVNDLPALKNDFITFGNLNNPCKTNDSVFDLWADVLSAVDRSRLTVLVMESSHGSRIRAAFEQRGIAGDRIHAVELRPRPQYLELYHQIDIGLDTFPYNGHNTSLDSYWMGVPVVTLVGPTVVGRAGLSQLTNLNLADLIAHTPEDFVEIARTLSADLDRLNGLRATLRQRMQASVLMDAPRFAKNIEAAYRRMWQRYCDK